MLLAKQEFLISRIGGAILSIMPIGIEFRHEGVGVIIKLDGVPTIEDFIDLNERLLASPEGLQKLRYGVIDFTAVETLSLNYEKMALIARGTSTLRPSFHLARWSLSRLQETWVMASGACGKVLSTNLDGRRWSFVPASKLSTGFNSALRKNLELLWQTSPFIPEQSATCGCRC